MKQSNNNCSLWRRRGGMEEMDGVSLSSGESYYHPDPEYYFKSVSIYRCVKKPDHVRFHLNSWEKRNDMDFLRESEESDDPEIPMGAEYLIILEDFIVEPAFGTALFFAKMDKTSDNYELCVGFYYAYVRVSK
jgi:hypothetical protein